MAPLGRMFIFQTHKTLFGDIPDILDSVSSVQFLNTLEALFFSHLLHSRHDKDDKVLEVEIERSSVWSNLELEAPTCAGSLDISFFPPHLTL